jgi:hypothetical protein
MSGPDCSALLRDGVLFQWGAYDWHDGEGMRFEVDIVRQFSIYHGDDYDHMEQLHCTFYFDAIEDKQRLGSGDLWGDPETPESLGEWAREVEALPVFSATMSSMPTSTRVEQEQV